MGRLAALDPTTHGTNNLFGSFFVEFHVRWHPHGFSPKVMQVNHKLC